MTVNLIEIKRKIKRFLDAMPDNGLSTQVEQQTDAIKKTLQKMRESIVLDSGQTQELHSRLEAIKHLLKEDDQALKLLEEIQLDVHDYIDKESAYELGAGSGDTWKKGPGARKRR